jgi:hypothetical protein
LQAELVISIALVSKREVVHVKSVRGAEKKQCDIFPMKHALEERTSLHWVLLFWPRIGQLEIRE